MIFLVLLSALSYMSNPLFVLYFSVPALIILTLGMIGNWRKYLPASIAVLGGFIMGIIGKQHDDIPFLAAPEAALPKGAVYSDLVKLVGSSPLVTVLILLFIFSLGYSIYISFRMIQKQKARGFAGEPSFYELYHLYSSLAIVLVLLSPLMIGGQRFSIELKDIAGIFILGIFNLGFIAGRHAHHEWKERLTYLSLLALAGVLAFVGLRWAKQNPLEAFQRMESYENKLVNTIDELKMLYPMSIGAASSEHAQTIRALSLQGTRCVSVGAGLVADFKNIHRLDYTQTTIDDTVRCEFNYVVLDGMSDTSLVRKFFGENITRVERNGFGIYLCPQFYYDDDGQPVMLNNYRFHYLYEDQAEESEVIDSTFTIE